MYTIQIDGTCNMDKTGFAQSKQHQTENRKQKPTSKL